MALLHVDQGTLQGQIFLLSREKTVLGRSPDCDLVISKNEAVSRWHAQILHQDDRYYIEDLESRNKTYVNDQKILPKTPVALNHKDCIRICQFQATFLESLENDYIEDHSSVVEASLSSNSDHSLETQPAAKLAELLNITAKLSKTLQLDVQLPEVVAGLLRLFPQADRCFLILTDEETDELDAKVVRVRKSQEEKNATFSRTVVRQCLRTGEALLSREGERLPAGCDSAASLLMRSIMCVPLSGAEGESFGVIQLDTQDDKKKFTEEDLRLLWGVSHQASIAMENARYHQEHLIQVRLKNELEMARRVHLNFFPQRLPEVAGYEFYAYYEAAREVGGDYHDFITLPDQRLVVVTGDVAGKGMPAALLMARLASESRYCFLTEKNPAQAVGKLNNQLYPLTSPTDRFVTLMTCVLDPRAHTLTLVNAGHPAPLVYRRPSGTFTKAITVEQTGELLGINEGCRYTSCQLSLEPGDYLLLFSDGVTDAQSLGNRSFRMKGIENVLQQNEKGRGDSPRSLGERIVKAVQEHALGRAQYDDITLICFGRPG